MSKTQLEISDPAEAKAAAATEADALTAEATNEPYEVAFGKRTYIVDADAGSDVEVLEDLQRYVDGSALVIPRLVQRLIGPTQYAQFKAEHRDPKTGRVPLDSLTQLFLLVDEAMGK